MNVELIYDPSTNYCSDQDPWQKLADFLGKMITTHAHEIDFESLEKKQDKESSCLK